MWPYSAIEKKAKSGRLSKAFNLFGEKGVYLQPEELQYILDIRPPHGSPDFPEENLNYARSSPHRTTIEPRAIRDDTWLFRFTTSDAHYPNKDKMVSGLWDVAAPVGHPSWEIGVINIGGGHLTKHEYTATEQQQIEIRAIIVVGGEDMYTYQILESHYHCAINVKVVEGR